MRRIARCSVAVLVALIASSARADTELVVASFPAFDASVKLAIPRFEALHPGVKVRLQSLAFGDHHNAMIAALASGTNVPDVMGLEISYVGRLAESNALEDLGAPPYRAGPLLGKMLKFARAQAMAGTGAIHAMPADVGPGTLLYRKDILDAAGVSEEELTRSWESYVEAGKKIKAATGAFLLAHAADIEDVYVRGGLKDGESIYVDVHTSRALFRSARFRRGFALAKMAREAAVDAKVGAWSSEWAEGLRTGTIATQMSGAWLAGHLEAWIAPGTRGLWRAAQLPGGAYATWGGSFYAIPKRAVHKTEAWELVKFLCVDGRQQREALRKLDAWPALLAAQRDAVVDEPIPFLGAQKARRLWSTAAARAPAIVTRKIDPVAADVLNAELEQVLEKDKPIPQALDDAAQQGCTPLRCAW